MAKQKSQFIKGLILGCLLGGMVLGVAFFNVSQNFGTQAKSISGSRVIPENFLAMTDDNWIALQPLLGDEARAQELEELRETAGYKEVDLIAVIGRIIKVFLGLLGVIAVGLIIYGGIVWMTAGGSDDKILTAKKIIKNAVIGLIIILAAYAITAFIMRRIGGTLVEQYEICTPGTCTGCHQICNAQGTGSEYTAGCEHLCMPPSSFVVKWNDPKDGETNVSLCRAIQAGFNDKLDPATVNANNILIKIKDGAGEGASCSKNKDCASGKCEASTCIGKTVAGTFTATVAANGGVEALDVFRFKAEKDFEMNTAYKVEITTNVRSEKNLAIKATDSKREWVFSTGEDTDTIPPQVKKVYPKDKDIDICLVAPVEALFNEPMDVISLRDRQSLSINPSVAAGFSHNVNNADTLIANPKENYQKNTKYTPLLNSNIIADSCGNLLDGDADGKAEKSPTDDYAPPPIGTAPDWSWTTGTTEYCTPEITDVIPSSEYYDGGSVTIKGNYFTLAGEVIFSDNVYSDWNCFDEKYYPGDACVSQWDDHEIKLKVPAGGGVSNGAINGRVWVEVGELLSNGVEFDVLSPHINWISPEKGGRGQPITISGANFGDNRGKVYFVDQDNHTLKREAEFPCEKSWKDNQIIIKVPEAPTLALGEYYLQVVTSDNHYSNIKDFVVNNSPPGPLICELDPECGLVGESVIIKGEKFGSNQGEVYFGDIKSLVDKWTPTEIKTKVPKGIKHGYSILRVKIGETESNGLSFASPCGLGDPCDNDITTSSCDPGACSRNYICNPNSCICQAKHCFNGTKDADEQGIDCGGANCDPCKEVVNECLGKADKTSCQNGQGICCNQNCAIGANRCKQEGEKCTDDVKCKDPYCASDLTCDTDCICRDLRDKACETNFNCNPNLVSVPGLVWDGSFEEDFTNWRMGGQKNSSATIENMAAIGGGSKTVHIHQDPNQDYPGRCDQKTCNNMPWCTWLPETNQCKFNQGDVCKGWQGPVYYNQGETLCWGNTNRVMWTYLTYNTVPLKLEPGQTYTYSFYYKGHSAGNLNMSLSYNIGWASVCWPKGYAGDNDCKKLGGECEKQPGMCCHNLPYQKKCYPLIHLGTLPAGNYPEWTKFTKTFVYTQEMTETLDRNGNLRNEIGVRIGYNSTGPLGTDLYIDNVQLEKGSVSSDLVCCNAKCQEVNQCRTYIPIIDSISPVNGMVKDPVTTYVTIRGKNFGQTQGSSKVYFGNKEASLACQTWSDTEIIVAAPFGINSIVPVKVVTSQGESNTKNFTVNKVLTPSICKLSPNHGKSGDKITIEGINFGDKQINEGYKSLVLFKDKEANVNSWSNNRISVTVPDSITVRDPKVKVILKWKEAPEGTPSNEVTFYMKPFITSITPNKGPIDTYVTIRGGNFGSQIGRVTFNDVQANLPSCRGAWSDSQIIALAPDSSTGPVVVKVTLPNGDVIESNKDKIFTYNNDPLAPGICLDKIEGAIGDPVKIEGNKLGETMFENEGVAFNQIRAAVSLENPDNWTNYRIDTNVPRTTSGEVIVTKIGQKQTGMECQGGIYILGICIGGTEAPVYEDITLNSNPVWFKVIGGDIGNDCVLNKDCQSGCCSNNKCALASECESNVPEHCKNGIKDEDEEGIDCGGKDCGACLRKECLRNNNCATLCCKENICVEANQCIGIEKQCPNPDYPEKCGTSCCPSGECKDPNKGNCKIDLCKEPDYPVQCGTNCCASGPCKDGNCPTPTGPPSVTDYSPTGTNVCRNVVISATFDQMMDHGSLNKNTIIVGDLEGRISSYNENNKTTAIFTPNGDLDSNTTYQVTIKKEVKSKTGKNMTSDYQWTFTTGDIFCKINKVEIKPPSRVFFAEKEEEIFTSQAYDKYNQPIQAIYSWKTDRIDNFVESLIVSDNQIKLKAKEKNGNDFLYLQADAWGGSKEASAQIQVFLCEYPWEYKDSLTQFRTFYCRDQ